MEKRKATACIRACDLALAGYATLGCPNTAGESAANLSLTELTAGALSTVLRPPAWDAVCAPCTATGDHSDAEDIAPAAATESKRNILVWVEADSSAATPHISIPCSA